MKVKNIAIFYILQIKKQREQHNKKSFYYTINKKHFCSLTFKIDPWTYTRTSLDNKLIYRLKYNINKTVKSNIFIILKTIANNCCIYGI
jgi:hypothetical protein